MLVAVKSSVVNDQKAFYPSCWTAIVENFLLVLVLVLESGALE
jgi:hypothetical protein